MATIVTRIGKGSALTFQEGDDNFTNLNTDKIEAVVDDTAPQLGGNLDADNNDITDVGKLTTTNVDATGSSGGHLRTSAGTDCLDWGAGGGANVSLLANMACGDNSIIAPTFKDYKETIHDLGSTDSPTITVSNGNVQSVTISSGLSLPAFSDAAAGQSVTLIVSGSGTVTGTGSHKFAGGNTDLTTESVVSIFYDGTTYYTSIATDFQ